jgi:PKD repeat protein
MSRKIRHRKSWLSLDNSRLSSGKSRQALQMERLEDRVVLSSWTPNVFFGDRTTTTTAYGDINGDRINDAVLAIGSQFFIFDGATGNLVNTFTAFPPPNTGKLQFFIADGNGDARADMFLKATVNGRALRLFYDSSELMPPSKPASAPTGVFGNGGPVAEGSSGTVSFTNVSGGTGGYTFSFDFDNNGTFEISNSVSPTATIPASYFPDGPGTRTVRGRVADSSGLFTDYTTTIQVTNVAPTAKVSGPGTVVLGKAATFQASASDPSPVDQAAGFTFAWDFGDGSKGTGASPSHTYAAPGTYTVTVRATDKDGATSAPATTTVTVTTVNPASGVTVTPDWIITQHDKIPNFGGQPTLVAAQSGNWSNPATWGGRLPETGDIVAIGQGMTVFYDQVSDVKIHTVSIEAGGTLQFRTDASTRLRVSNLLVLPEGTLTIGTQATPVASGVKAEVIINDTPLDLTKDPSQYGNGVLVFGKVSMHGAVLSDTWTRLATEPKAGDTTLTLSVPVIGWRVGDRIAIPDTRQLYSATRPDIGTFNPQWETAIIGAISADGKTITLTTPLAHDHLGARNPDGHLDFLPHIANLTRNVLVRSESNFGTRGHTFFTARADVDIRYTQFAGLGRTTNDHFNNTKYDSAGNVTHIGTNQKDRYPVNFHHLIGPATGQPNGRQFTFEGNSVVCLMNSFHFRWGVALKDSHYGQIKGNVVYNWAGAGIVTQDAGSSYNVIENNWVSRVAMPSLQPGVRPDNRGVWAEDPAFEGSGLWFRGPNNYVRGNVVSNSSYGVTYYMFLATQVKVPAFQGANPSQAGQSVTVNMTNTPLLQFENNEIYGGNTATGVSIWSLGTLGTMAHANASPSVIKNLRAWHLHRMGFFLYETNRLTIDGFVYRGNTAQLEQFKQGTEVIYAGDYMQKDLLIINSDIQGGIYGWAPSTHSGGGYQRIENTILRNVTNIVMDHLWNSEATAQNMPPRTIIIDNVKFAQLPISGQNQRNILLIDEVTKNPQNFITSDKVFVYNYNQVAGDNFRVYYKGQAPNAIVPQSIYNSNGTTRLTGAPVAGLTNKQTWELYGIAVAGEVAPEDTTIRPLIHGLVKSF